MRRRWRISGDIRQTGETLSGLLLRLAGEWWLNRLVDRRGDVGIARKRKEHALEILNRQRQRRQRRDDSIFKFPCKTFQTCGTHPHGLKCAECAKEVQKPSGFWRRFLHTFCRCWQKVSRRRHPRPQNKTSAGDTVSGAHGSHIPNIVQQIIQRDVAEIR